MRKMFEFKFAPQPSQYVDLVMSTDFCAWNPNRQSRSQKAYKSPTKGLIKILRCQPSGQPWHSARLKSKPELVDKLKPLL